MFHNYTNLIKKEKRSFQLVKHIEGYRDTDTSRFYRGGYADPVNCEGVFETLTEKDYARFTDEEKIKSDLKITTTPELMNNVQPEIKDKVVYNDITYWIHRVYNQLHYGNYWRIFLKSEEIGV